MNSEGGDQWLNTYLWHSLYQMKPLMSCTHSNISLMWMKGDIIRFKCLGNSLNYTESHAQLYCMSINELKRESLSTYNIHAHLSLYIFTHYLCFIQYMERNVAWYLNYLLLTLCDSTTPLNNLAIQSALLRHKRKRDSI